MLRKIRHLQSKQNKDLGDRISIKTAHNLSALPGWGAIPSYQDESETIKAATAGENDYEFWVTQINSSNIEIIFEGSIKVDHGLEKDTYYYLSSKKPGRISLTQAYPHQAPCLYVLDKQNLRLLEARDTLSNAQLNEETIQHLKSLEEITHLVGNTEVFSEKLSQIEAKVADLEDHKDSDLTEDVEAIASEINTLGDTLHQRIDLLTESFNSKLNQLSDINAEEIGELKNQFTQMSEYFNSKLNDINLADIGGLEARLSELSESIIEQLKTRLTQLSELINNQAIGIDAERIGQLETQVTQLSELINNQAIGIDAEKIGQLETQVTQLSESFNNQSTGIDAEKIGQLETQVTQLSESFNNQSTGIDAERIGQLETRLSRLSESFNNQAIGIDAEQLETRLTQLSESINNQSTGIGAERIGQLETRLSRLSESFNNQAIGIDAEQLETRLSQLSESINNQLSGIDAEEIGQLKTQITQLTKLNDLDDEKLANLEIKINQLLTLGNFETEGYGNLEKAIGLLTELNNSNSERLVSVEEKIEDIISTNKNTADNLNIMNDRFASFDKLEQSIEQLQQSNYSTEVLIQEPTARYIDLRLADYSKFPTNQSDISKPTLIQGKTFRGERSPTKGMVLSRIDGKVNNQELFVFEGFRGSSSQTFEAIFSFTTKADKYNIKGFWGLGGLNYNMDFTNAHKEYFAIADYFSNGTFYGAYGTNNYRVNHGNLSLTPDRDWCKLSFIAGGKSARLVKLDSAILDEVDPRQLFDSKWETKSEVNWSSTIALPTELIGAIALRETTNSALNILAVALR